MYGIFTYIWLMFMVNVGKYTIHGSYGFGVGDFSHEFLNNMWGFGGVVAFTHLHGNTWDQWYINLEPQ